MSKREVKYDKVFDNLADPLVQEAVAKYGKECEPGTEFLIKPSTVCLKCSDGSINVSNLHPQKRGDIVRLRG